MKRTFGRSRLGGAMLAVASLCALALPQIGSVQASSTIVVATRGFTEVQVAGYLYADLLRAHGFTVDTSHFTFTTEATIMTALQHNQVDLIPDYLGNGLTIGLNKPYKPGSSVPQLWQKINKAFVHKWKIHWLKPAFHFNDQNVFVTRRKVSQRLGLKSLTDLAHDAPKIRLAILKECTTRTDCYKGFKRIYHPKKFKSLYDTSLNGSSVTHPPFYDDLLKNKYDVVQGYGTTDAAIAHYNLVALTDPKHMLPPDEMTPVIRGSVLSANPAIKTWLNKLSPILTNSNFRHMNALVAFGGKQPQAVADAFLRAHHLM